MTIPFSRIRNVLTACLFGSAISLPLLLTLARPLDRQWHDLKTALSPFDLSDPKTLARALPKRFEKYLSDHLKGRKTLILLANRMDYALNGWRESIPFSPTQVLIGKNQWLFYTGDYSMEDFSRKTSFSEEQILAWRHAFQQRQAWTRSRGIAYLWVIAPNKETIYPEYYPSFMSRQATTGFRETLVQHFGISTGGPVFDLTPALIAAKELGLLYYRLDTHWNALGGWVGVKSIMAYLHAKGWPAEPIPLSRYRTIPKRRDKSDMTEMLQVSGRLQEDIQEFVPAFTPCAQKVSWTERYEIPPHMKHLKPSVITCEKRRGTVLFISDSYGNFFEPYLAELFGKIITIPSDRGRVDFDYFKLLIEKEAPDVVIEERAERYIKYGPDLAGAKTIFAGYPPKDW